MTQRRLRIFHGEEDKSSQEANSTKESIKIRLNDVFPLMADALLTQRSWLSDFGDDEITISGDLYDVLMAYRHFRMSA